MTKHHSHTGSFDLRGIAHQAMLDAGFSPDMPQSVTAELQSLSSPEPDRAAAPLHVRRSLVWSSIDDAKSRDLDQVEYVERFPSGGLRVLVGIADVDALVEQ